MESDLSSGGEYQRLPTADEARAALAEAERAKAAIATVTPPAWYFLALGALIAALGPGVAVLPRSPLALLAVPVGAVWAAILGLLVRAVTNRMGVVGRWDWRLAWPLVVPTALLLLVALVAAYAFGMRWALPAYFVAEGVLVVCFGVRYVRRAGRGTR